MNEPETNYEPITGTLAEVFSEEPAPTPAPTPAAEPETPEGGEPKGSTPSASAPGAQPPSGTGALTPEQITTSVREGLKQAQPPEAPRQYTPQELDQIFNVYQPTPEVLSQLLAGGDDALKAFVTIREGLARQFGTLLQYQLEVMKTEMMSKVDPALRFVAERAAAQEREDFFSQHEDLRDHEELTQMVFNALKGEGYQAPDLATAYKTLADRTRALLPTTAGNGSASPSSGGGRTAKPTQTGKRPASLSSGSQAGGGGTSAPAGPFPGAEVYM